MIDVPADGRSIAGLAGRGGGIHVWGLNGGRAVGVVAERPSGESKVC